MSTEVVKNAYGHKWVLVEISGEKSIMKEIDLIIIQAMADGSRAADIAKQTGYSVRTIEGKITSLQQQYECKTSSQLVAMFIRLNLIS